LEDCQLRTLDPPVTICVNERPGIIITIIKFVYYNAEYNYYVVKIWL